MNKWEAKERYVERLMADNSEVDTLTDDQHDTLASLCSFRHNLHTFGADALYNDESANNKTMWNHICSDLDSDMYINTQLRSVNLPIIPYLDTIDVFWTTSGDYPDEEEEEEARELLADLVENINREIEAYLSNIDKTHGTKYAPTGIARNRI